MATDPTYPWFPLEDFLEHLGIGPEDRNAGNAERARAGAAALVERARPDRIAPATLVEEVDTFVASPDLLEGAVLLAARLYARRGSPAGVASFAEFGPSQVLRFDPDIDRLLGLGRYARPRVG